ncbi:tripartite tricarboxylate transporter substrate binding protein [Ramlibacter sp.]|uniref:tripartite tricarboxylate transporter substrate binding protein n=1 Tax=Ramlibacter sp. TaxID=1917967 RepID=UPI0035AE8EAC
MHHPAIRLLVVVLLLAGMRPAFASDWQPRRPVTIVVPYAAGGGNDTLARAVGRQLARQWAEPVVVENLPGADGFIGTRRVMEAEADGHTLLLQIPSLLLMRHLPALKGVDPLARLLPVVAVASAPAALVTGGAQPFRSLEDLVRHCRSASPPCTAAAVENSGRLRMRQFALDQGLADFPVASYRGSSQVVPDLASGQVVLASLALNTMLPLHRSGQLRILATSGARRAAVLPDVPTSEEAGWAGSQSVVWFGLFVPRDTPPAVVEALAAAIRKAGRSDEVQAVIATAGAEADTGTPAEFAEQIRRDAARLAEQVRRFPLE